MINFRTILLLSNGAPGCFISPCKNSCPKLEWTFTDDTHHPVFSDYRVEASLAGKRGTGSIDRSLDFFLPLISHLGRGAGAGEAAEERKLSEKVRNGMAV